MSTLIGKVYGQHADESLDVELWASSGKVELLFWKEHRQNNINPERARALAALLVAAATEAELLQRVHIQMLREETEQHLAKD